MKERLIRFFAGRNGMDPLNRFLSIAGIVLFLLASIFSRSLGSVLYPLFLILLILIYFRMLSRNLYRRREENAKYMELRARAQGSLRLLRERWVQRKDYRFYRCPSCKTTLRVPRGRGKIKIVCRKCGASFTRNS